MSLINIIRRTASLVVPCASRVLRRQSYYCHSASATTTRGGAAVYREKVFRGGVVPLTFRSYSTIPRPDKSLIKIIESEIQCVVDSADHNMLAEERRDGFPFEIEENPGRETIILTRDFKGEKISVEVYMPCLIAEFGEVPLTVKVFKKSGVYLEFAGGVDNGELAIVSLTINDPKAKDESLTTRAPAFKDLDDNLQKAFHKYLERRKISPHIVEFLQEYTSDKDTKECFNWYNTVKHFVKSDSG